MQQNVRSKTIGYWLADKKIQRSNLNEFKKFCKKSGYDLVKIDLTKSLEDQGPFCVIFHKLTGMLVEANAGDVKAKKAIVAIEQYLEAHPEVPIVDPLNKVRQLIDRYTYYLVLQNNLRFTSVVFIPTSVELTSSDPAVNLARLKEAGVQFPFVCKPSVAHGTTAAHMMSLIFNEAGVADCKPPCVAQTFINHNAVLYKIYCVGDHYFVQERPSIKNFYSFAEHKTIFFSTHDVSKMDSASPLSVLDADDPEKEKQVGPLDQTRLSTIVETTQECIGLKLIGMDVVIENGTGRYAIIDINAYPSYDGYPNVHECMLQCLEDTMVEHRKKSTTLSSEPVSPTGDKFILGRSDQEDSGFDTSDSSDEKMKNLSITR